MRMNTFGRKIKKALQRIQLGKLMKQKLQSLKRLMQKSKALLKSALRILLASLLMAGAILAVPAGHSAYLFSKVGSQTVYIQAPEGARYQGSATGFQIKAPSGTVYTLTNAHVCELQKDGMVMIKEKQNSGRLIPRRVIEVWAQNDLCLVEGLTGYSGLTLADSWEVDDINWAIGYPLGEALNMTSGFLKEKANVDIALMEVEPAQCKGVGMHVEKIDLGFISFPVCFVTRSAIQTNITIFPGNSGSPMVNAFGNVTGVVFASNSFTAWGSSVPLEDVIEFIKAY